jgi:hypothetical protein
LVAELKAVIADLRTAPGGSGLRVEIKFRYVLICADEAAAAGYSFEACLCSTYPFFEA